MNPLISVVMSVYNGEKYLAEAIDSILHQTYADFEFIIVDDGSVDSTEEILQAYKKRDHRITNLNNERNIGLADSLNLGISKAQGKYIARMDADDISMPDRFEKQIQFLEENPGIRVLGTNVYRIDENGRILREVAYPTLARDMRWNMIWGNNAVVCHPSVMMAAEWVRNIGLYKDQPTSQDLELWSRVFTEEPLPIWNMQLPLLKYRVHPESTSIGGSDRQFKVSNETRLNTINSNFKTTYAVGLVEAFRTPNPDNASYSKKEIVGFIRSWLEVLTLFQDRFDLTNNEVKEYYMQTLDRIKNYVSLNPLTIFKEGLIWQPRLLSCLHFSDWWNIFQYKVNRHTGKS